MDEPFCDNMTIFFIKNYEFFIWLRRILLPVVKVSMCHLKTGWKWDDDEFIGKTNGRMVQIFYKSHDIREEVIPNSWRIVYLMSFQWVIYLFFSLLAHPKSRIVKRRKQRMSSFTNPNHGPNNPAGQEGQQQSGLDQTRQQVDEVVDIMRNNVEKGKSLELLISYESYALFLAHL